VNDKPVVVPTLDALASDLSLINTLPPETAKALCLDVMTLEKALMMRAMMGTQNGSNAEVPQSERWLKAKEAATLFNVSERWLRDNKTKLPCSKVSHKKLLFEETKLRKWFTSRKAH